MARWEFKLPDIGEGVAEGEIVSWHVAAGDVVREDQPVVDVMTDKATVTITAPKTGIVVETRGRIGETVAIHSVLVVFDLDVTTEGTAPGGPPSAANEGGGARAPKVNGTTAASRRGARSSMAVGELPESLPGVSSSIERRSSAAAGYFNEKPLATPATRKLARDMNLDLRLIPPTGPQGRVTRIDVEAFAEMPVSGSPPAPRTALSSTVADAERHGNASAEERIPFAGLRRKIAQKMALATSKAAHFTFVEECDVTELKSMRERLKSEASQHGAKLSFLPFIVKAVVAALKKHPMLNAMLDEASQEIVVRRYYNIGIATATEAGLLVPVVRDADRKSLLAIAREIERLSADARAGKASREDLQGSTFTITSLGARAGLLATPIINFPEVAILGVHQIKQRPVVRQGQIVVGDVMLLSLSFDHRLVDGHVGAAFAYDVIGYLEQPERLLLEMA